MILNPDKFQAIVREKQKLKNTGVKFVSGSEKIQAVSVDMLGITIDDKLNFNSSKNFSEVCKSTHRTC